MTYFNIIYKYINYLNSVHGYKTTFLLLSLVLILCHKLYYYKNKTQDLKIYNNFLLFYIEKDLKCPTKNVSLQEVEKYMYFAIYFIQTRQFIRQKNTNIFLNIYTQETFSLEKIHKKS